MPTAICKTALVSVDTAGAKRAVEAAWDYFHALFPSKPSSAVSLEEVESSSDGRYWLVTLSYEEPRRKDPHLPDFLQVPVRKLKVFKVDKMTGKVLSMKMRQSA